ncbi:hypothetical protein ACFL0K_02795 [Patescibacteria group bacterium]
MSYKKSTGVLFSLSLVIGIAGLIFANPVSIGVCDYIDYSCRSAVLGIAFPVWVLSLSLAIISLILIFLRKEIFHTWGIYFASWFLPLSVLLIYLTPVSCGSSFGCFVDREFTTMFMAGAFLTISILIIAIKSWKLRKMNGAE